MKVCECEYQDIDTQYEDGVIIPHEMLDFIKILSQAAKSKKYKANNWLDKDGVGCTHKYMHDSMFHHLAKSYSNDRIDDESKMDHLLHLAVRALMLYTRIQRGLQDDVD